MWRYRADFWASCQTRLISSADRFRRSGERKNPGRALSFSRGRRSSSLGVLRTCFCTVGVSFRRASVYRVDLLMLMSLLTSLVVIVVIGYELVQPTELNHGLAVFGRPVVRASGCQQVIVSNRPDGQPQLPALVES